MNRLTEEILASCEWRNSELENLKKVGIITFNSQKERVKEQYYRMCIPYIYAHWEGFVVESFKLLITYLNSLDIAKEAVIENVYTFSLLNSLKPLSGKQSFEQCTEFVNKFTYEYGKKLFIPPSIFTTKSNLNYKQLQIIFKWFGMTNNCTMFESNINKLVVQRNRIAHGENGIIIHYNDIEEFCEVLQKIFDILVITFDDYINNANYLKPQLLQV